MGHGSGVRRCTDSEIRDDSDGFNACMDAPKASSSSELAAQSVRSPCRFGETAAVLGAPAVAGRGEAAVGSPGVEDALGGELDRRGVLEVEALSGRLEYRCAGGTA